MLDHSDLVQTKLVSSSYYELVLVSYEKNVALANNEP